MFGDFNINKIPIEAFTDNRPTEQSIRSTKQVQEKRLRIDIGEIQRLIEHKEITDVKWICKEKQLADGLTKRDVDMENVMNMILNYRYINITNNYFTTTINNKQLKERNQLEILICTYGHCRSHLSDLLF